MEQEIVNIGLLDKIKFGNPTMQDLEQINTKNYLDRLLTTLGTGVYVPPKNSSRATREELNLLVDYSGKVEAKGRKNIFDTSLVPAIQDLFIRNGADPVYIKKISADVVNDITPLIVKLKYLHNRPRPQQLAHYYHLKLYPEFSYFVSSPSFPSTHTTIAAVLCEVLGNHFPEAYQTMQSFITEVSESRLYLGVHYPSDNDLARKVAELILKNGEFKQKFNL